ncbi:MAG: RnfABCDGE type electron transport complex subunit D [Anaerolineae bacterium]|nr:RnfABCDGE type electron transport complex subunit D [Anaerolineae bacterium]
MFRFIDKQLNGVTMYRLILYYLMFLLGTAVLLSFAHLLPYDPFTLLFSIGFLVAVSGIANRVFAWAYNVHTNVESVWISALILGLILTPSTQPHDLIGMGWAAVLAMASKYILAINKKHIFNPVAMAVAITAVTIDQTASWWVGTAAMLPVVLIGGVLIVHKIQREDMVVAFLLTALTTSTLLSFGNGDDIMLTMQRTLLTSPLLFFAFVFLTEPLTTPPTRMLQIVYGLLVGVLFAPQVHFGGFYMTPELALIAGNVFSYLVSPKTKLVLRLKNRIQIAPDAYDFIFAPQTKLSFAPGQYMEWTLGHDDPDNRGVRRYFTLASSPTEPLLRVGVKFYDQSSTYKHTLLTMDEKTEIVAAQIAGDFTLPHDATQKCVLIAGGIGITPFRSMIKFLLDTHQRRSVVLLYSNRTADEIVYSDVFNAAQRQFGLRTVYTLTDPRQAPRDWTGKLGYIDEKMIRETVPDYLVCQFFISGPNQMVNAVSEALIKLGVNGEQIKTDYFPGLA